MLSVDYVNKKGNWYKYNCPKGVSVIILNYAKNLMRKEGMSAKKIRRFNKVYISCKRTETSVFYKILVFGNKNLVCFDMGNNTYSYKWYEKDPYQEIPYFGDSSRDCSTCGYPNYIKGKRSDAREKLKKHPNLKLNTGYGTIIRNRKYSTINEDCYKFIDSIKKHIPIRVLLTRPVTIDCNKENTYLLLVAIKNKKKDKRMSELDDMFIFKRIVNLPNEIIVHIISFL
jgi:hypothetical protein